MQIKEASQVTDKHLGLLLEADPSRNLVEEYLQRGVLLEACMADEVIGVMVLLLTRPQTLEIVNLAVAKAYRGQKIAQRLIATAIQRAKQQQVKTIEIGTGSTGIEQLYLYQKCGFRLTHIERDFFVKHYAEPIIENGLVLRDMVRLSMDI